MQIKTRFAPTPSGFLHQGNVFSFLLTWLIARKSGGEILLRIDDLDQPRVQLRYIEHIFRVTDWLGLDYDAGPQGVEDHQKNYSQLRRMDLYHEAIDQLEALPETTFYCDCSRKEILRISGDATYPGTCLEKQLTSAPGRAMRLRTPTNHSEQIDDLIQGSLTIPLSQAMPHFVIKKKDGYPSYQLGSVVDDHYFGINTVIRGLDLVDSTAAQCYLATRLTVPFGKSRFYHHPLLTRGKSKLSKSTGDGMESIGGFSTQSKKQMITAFSNWLGLKYAGSNMDDLLQLFNSNQLQQLQGSGR